MNARSDFNDLAAEAGLPEVRRQVEAATQAHDVADWPMPLTDATHPPELRADLLPGWLGRYVGALSASTQTPATMSVLFALSVVAACIQRRYAVAPLGLETDYTESASLWSLSVAASGSRKSAVVDALAAPLVTWEKRAGDRMRREVNAVMSRIIVADATIKRLQAQAGKAGDAQERERLRQLIEVEQNETPERLYPPRVFTGDATVERVQSMLAEQGGRVAVLSDEGGLFSTLAGTYGGGAGPSLDALLQGHSGGAVRVDRATRTAHVNRAAVTLGLMLQPDLLNDAAGSNRFRASGLMARFAYAIPRPFVGGRNVRNYALVSQDLRAEYGRQVDALLGDPTEGPHKPPIVLAMSDAARERWLDFSQEIENALGPDGDLAAVADWGAKLAGMAARIALLFELVAAGAQAEMVNEDSVRQAIALAKLLVPHAKAAFRLLAADEVDRDADAVMAWVMRVGVQAGFRQSEAQVAMHGRFKKVERLVAALQRLQSSGCLRHESVKNAGARASSYWRVNPRLFLQ